MPELLLGTSREDRLEFHKLMIKFSDANGAKGDKHIDEIESWLEEFAQKCFEIGKESNETYERSD